LTDGVERLLKSRMTSRGCVVELVEQALAESGRVGDAESVLEIPEGVALLKELGALGVVRRVEGVLGVGRGNGGKKVVGNGDLGRK
jgi:hypothetical protein